MTTTNGKNGTSVADSSPTVDPSVHPALGVDYRSAGAVRRMLNERANATAYGDTDRVERIDRDLKEAGFTGDATAFAAGGDKTPVGRTSGKPDVTSPVVTSSSPPTSSSSSGGVTSSLLSPTAPPASPKSDAGSSSAPAAPATP